MSYVIRRSKYTHLWSVFCTDCARELDTRTDWDGAARVAHYHHRRGVHVTHGRDLHIQLSRFRARMGFTGAARPMPPPLPPVTPEWHTLMQVGLPPNWPQKWPPHPAKERATSTDDPGRNPNPAPRDPAVALRNALLGRLASWLNGLETPANSTPPSHASGATEPKL